MKIERCCIIEEVTFQNVFGAHVNFGYHNENWHIESEC